MNNEKTVSQTVEKYKDQIKQAIINAVRLTKSCVLFYSDITMELERLIDDGDEYRRVESALWESIDGLKLGDIKTYRIYQDVDASYNDVIVVTFGKELTEKQLYVLQEVAELFDTDFYDRYGEADGVFYDGMPLFKKERTEVYTVMHNLMRKWFGCEWLFDDEGDEEES